VENWSGILPHTVEQDLYASLVRANCAAVLALAVRPEKASLHALRVQRLLLRRALCQAELDTSSFGRQWSTCGFV